MVQIKVSVAFILAATAIAPAVSRPLSRRGDSDVTGSVFSRRFLEARGPGHMHGHGQREHHHHHHQGEHHHHGHREGTQGAVANQDPSNAATDPNVAAADPTRREYLEARGPGEHMHGHGQREHHHHHHHQGEHHHHGHHEMSQGAVATQDPSSAPTDPNAATGGPTRREYLEARGPGGHMHGHGQREHHHHHHQGEHHHHGHHEMSQAAVATQDPSSAPTDPNAATGGPTRREYLEARGPGGHMHGHGQREHHHHHHHQGEHRHHGHHESSQGDVATQDPSSAPTDPNAATSGPTRREYLEARGPGGHMHGHGQREHHHHHHQGEHHHHGHHESSQGAVATQDPSNAPTDPDAATGPTTREFDDELFGRSFDEFDFDARDLYLD